MGLNKGLAGFFSIEYDAFITILLRFRTGTTHLLLRFDFAV